MASKKSVKAKKPAAAKAKVSPKKPAKVKAKVVPTRKPIAKAPAKPAAKSAKASKTVVKAKAASKPLPVAKKSGEKASGKPIIRTGPSITPRAPGSILLSGHARPGLSSKQEKAKPLTKKEMEGYRDLLLKLRDRVIDEISFLANDNLNRSSKEASGDLSGYSFHMADQGTDNFDREFAASLLNNEHDVLYEIEEALRRIDQGTYGTCESSGRPIERERLKVLPFVRYCVAVQSEMERGKPRFRPFRRTNSIQTAEPSNGDTGDN